MKKIIVAMLTIGMVVACKNPEQVNKEVEAAKVATIDSMKQAQEKQRIIDSMQQINELNQSVEKEVMVQQTAAPATTTQPRKKWSGAAKGAVIGAGVGAVTGAIVSKKKGEGAIIGGLAGAGVGAGTGAIIDDSKKK